MQKKRNINFLVIKMNEEFSSEENTEKGVEEVFFSSCVSMEKKVEDDASSLNNNMRKYLLKDTAKECREKKRIEKYSDEKQKEGKEEEEESLKGETGNIRSKSLQVQSRTVKSLTNHQERKVKRQIKEYNNVSNKDYLKLLKDYDELKAKYDDLQQYNLKLEEKACFSIDNYAEQWKKKNNAENVLLVAERDLTKLYRRRHELKKEVYDKLRYV